MRSIQWCRWSDTKSLSSAARCVHINSSGDSAQGGSATSPTAAPARPLYSLSFGTGGYGDEELWHAELDADTAALLLSAFTAPRATSKEFYRLSVR